MVEEIIWLRRAKKNFQLVVNYLQDQWNSTVALEFLLKTEKILEILKNFPNSGRSLKNRKILRQFLITEHNYLVYRVIKNKLIVVNIYDTRRK